MMKKTIALFFVFLFFIPSEGASQEKWTAVDKLVSEQKVQAALDKTSEILKAAKKAKDGKTWTDALIRSVQYESALHGYETAVRFLKDEPWPDGAERKVLLNLYFAHLLMVYSDAYRWEISQREKTVSSEKVDLKAWTLLQIGDEIRKSFDAVLSHDRILANPVPESFKTYITGNNFPENVRPSLRDAVTYMISRHLADSAYWTPEQSNEFYRLRPAALLKQAPGLAVADSKNHPMAIAASQLNGLHAFHKSAGRPDGAAEAKYDLFRKLFAAYTEAGDKEEVRDQLKAFQKDKGAKIWWPAGQALLADMHQVSQAPDRMIVARNEAKAGIEFAPKSMAAAICESIVKAIEAPRFQISTMDIDGPSRDSFKIEYTNVKELHFRAYPIDLKGRIGSVKGNQIHFQSAELRKIISEKAKYFWQVGMTDQGDYLEHRWFSSSPIDKKGWYLVAASANADFTEKDNAIAYTYFTLGDVILETMTPESGSVEVRVRSGSTGEALAGAKVSIYQFDWNSSPSVFETKTADKNGTVEFTNAKLFTGAKQYFVAAEHKGEFVSDLQTMYLYRSDQEGTSRGQLIFTDRAVYRPVQKIFWKIAAYEGESSKGKYKSHASGEYEVTLRDPNYQEVAKKTVKTNAFGTASGEFLIPAGRPLGHWMIQTVPKSGAGGIKFNNGGSTSFRVEEYKRPTFEVQLKEADENFRLNKPAKVEGEARYYFGSPVSSGKVAWSVTRTPVLPWWWYYWHGRGGDSGRSQTIASGVSKLKEDGTFSIEFTPEADERQNSKDISYNFTIDADVTDEGGETRSAGSIVRAGFVSVEATVIIESGFYKPGGPVGVKVNLHSLGGKPVKGKGTYKVSRVTEPEKTFLPAELPLQSFEETKYSSRWDGKRARWETSWSWESTSFKWKTGSKAAEGALVHSEKGDAEVTIKDLKEPGIYRFTYETKDAFGTPYSVSRDFIVAGGKGVPKFPLVAILENPSVKVGDTARMLIGSGLKDQPIFVDYYRGGKRYKRETRLSGKDGVVVEYPIAEDDRGGFGVAVAVLRDHQWMRQELNVFVPWDNKDLTVEMATFRDKMRPGSKETFRVKVKGPDQKAAQAEILSYMYDRSLDLFAPHSPASFKSLYPYRSGVTSSRVTLGENSNNWWVSNWPNIPTRPSLIENQLRFVDRYGLGGPGYRGGRYHREMERDDIAEGALAMPASAPAETKATMEVADKLEESPKRKQSPQKESRLKDLEKNNAKPEPAGDPAPAQEIRSDFSETAFWKPHLIADADGSAAFEFQVPDSVTSWNLWVVAVTKDIKSGQLSKETKTVKELMVRPYVPRFLREGDTAEIKVVVNNASDKALKGEVTFDIQDPETEKSLIADFGMTKKDLTKSFSAPKDGSATLNFALKTPKRVGTYAFKVLAKTKEFSDGERRPFPVLPSRVHLAQSRFTVLKQGSKKTLEFKELAEDKDPTRINEKMVVTVDGQLFFGILQSLPYLYNYPYECTEQTLNRFMSASILTSLFSKYPAVEKMSESFSSRKTQFEKFDEPDANRRMALEETPYLQQAKGGPAPAEDLSNMLAKKSRESVRASSLEKLRKAQLDSGAFPWFQGGPPDAYMTLYIMYGFSKALEFKADVPKDMVVKSWRYLNSYFDEHWKDWIVRNCCWEYVTFLNYVLSNYPDLSWTGGVFTENDRKEMLDFSFKYWKNHSPYLKGYLALTLKRMNRGADAKLVWDSVMDSSKTDEIEGTHWAREDRSWLWYNDTIETHAMALRTLMELGPKDKRNEGLVQWIFLNKKLNHWKSTRATSEVIYSVLKYLDENAELGKKEAVTVQVSNQKTKFEFEADKYTGKKNQIVVEGGKFDPKTASKVQVEKEGPGMAFASATWHFSTDEMVKSDSGDFFSVSRKYFKRSKQGSEFVLKPLSQGDAIEIGDQVEVQISLRAKHEAEYVHLRDPRAAGLEPESQVSGYKWDLGIFWYEEIRDSGTNFFFSQLPKGEYTFKYRLRANMAGKFRVGPATVQSMYAPEFNAYSASGTMNVK